MGNIQPWFFPSKNPWRENGARRPDLPQAEPAGPRPLDTLGEQGT